MKKVSVIIPCFNQGQYLKEALASVQASSYRNIEIVVVNDGSNDIITQTIINKILNVSNIKTITTENLGVCNARNIGIKAATGEYILPLDADDKIHPSYIEKAVSILENYSDIGIVYCKAEMFGSVNKKWDLKPANTLNMLIQNRIFSSAMYRKTKFIEIGVSFIWQQAVQEC